MPDEVGGGETQGLEPAELRSIRAQLAQAPGKRKLDLLLSAPDPVALIQSLPEQELYLAVLDIGPDDAADVVSLASPEQFAHFLDRGAWPRPDQGPSTRNVLRWLSLAREGADTSDQALERYRHKLASLDAELLELLLREELIIHSLEENPDPPIADGGRTFHSYDGKYIIEFAAEGADYGTLKQLLEDLFAQDTLGTTRLLEAVRWELPSELAETAFRWRQGRLRDLGFPTLEEALAFYARPAKRAQPAPADAAPAAQGGALQHASATALPLLDRALLLVPPESFPRVEEGVVYAANAALVANGVAADDILGVRAALGDARNTLSLGLDALADGDPARAASLLATRAIRDVFQAGMGELYALQTRARRVAAAARLPSAKSATVLESPYSDLIEALDRKRPALPDPSALRRQKVPYSRGQIAAAEAMLDEAEAVVAMLAAVGLAPVALGALAEAAGLAPSAVRARDVLVAKARAEVLGQPGLAFADAPGEPDQAGPSSELVDQKLDALLTSAAKLVGTPAAERAAARLRRPRQ